jgi:hypothetical protein
MWRLGLRRVHPGMWLVKCRARSKVRVFAPRRAAGD